MPQQTPPNENTPTAAVRTETEQRGYAYVAHLDVTLEGLGVQGLVLEIVPGEALVVVGDVFSKGFLPPNVINQPAVTL